MHACAHSVILFVLVCVSVLWAEGLSCMVHSGFTLAPMVSPWQQIPHSLSCQLSTAFHTTCNICSLLTSATTVSKNVQATKYHISLYRKFHIHIVSCISLQKVQFYCIHCCNRYCVTADVIIRNSSIYTNAYYINICNMFVIMSMKCLLIIWIEEKLRCRIKEGRQMEAQWWRQHCVLKSLLMWAQPWPPLFQYPPSASPHPEGHRGILQAGSCF